MRLICSLRSDQARLSIGGRLRPLNPTPEIPGLHRVVAPPEPWLTAHTEPPILITPNDSHGPTCCADRRRREAIRRVQPSRDWTDKAATVILLTPQTDDGELPQRIPLVLEKPRPFSSACSRPTRSRPTSSSRRATPKAAAFKYQSAELTRTRPTEAPTSAPKPSAQNPCNHPTGLLGLRSGGGGLLRRRQHTRDGEREK